MYHSITFWDGQSVYTAAEAEAKGDPTLAATPKGINTWDDWHLIPTEKPSIALPGYEANQFEIHGRAGSIDLADKIYDGTIVYSDRNGNLQFYIDHEKDDWLSIRQRIASTLHGKTVKMILEDDPGYYYEGEFYLTAIMPGASYSQLTIRYQLRPFRHYIYLDSRLGNVYWDPFNFETDYDLSVSPDYQHIQFSSEGVL